jgi:hypothetical protein
VGRLFLHGYVAVYKTCAIIDGDPLNTRQVVFTTQCLRDICLKKKILWGGKDEVSVLNTFHKVNQLLKKYSAPQSWIQNTQYVVWTFYSIITVNREDGPLRLRDYRDAPNFSVKFQLYVPFTQQWSWGRGYQREKVTGGRRSGTQERQDPKSKVFTHLV